MSTGTTYGCPTWCIRTDHHADVIDADHPPRHYGPEFGSVNLQGTSSANLLAEIPDLEVKELAAHDLYQLAADCMQAGIWLDRFADRYDRGEIR